MKLQMSAAHLNTAVLGHVVLVVVLTQPGN